MSALKASEAPHQFTIKLLDKTINLRVEEVQILNTFFSPAGGSKRLYFFSNVWMHPGFFQDWGSEVSFFSVFHYL